MKIKSVVMICLKILLVLVVVMDIELVSTFVIGRPIFSKKSGDIYYGLFFDVYYCDNDKYDMPNIISKFSKFNCPEREEIDFSKYHIVGDVRDNCTDEEELYIDGNRDVYLVCMDSVYVMDEYTVLTELKKFINSDIAYLDKLLENYKGVIAYDGGSIEYNLKVNDKHIKIYKCNSLSGNKNIYIGNGNMKFMCN